MVTLDLESFNAVGVERRDAQDRPVTAEAAGAAEVGHARAGHEGETGAWDSGSARFRKGSNCLKIEAAAIACPAGSQ